MRTINHYSDKPKKSELIPVGDGKRAWAYVRTNIKSETYTDEDGNERKDWTAVEYSAQVNTLNFHLDDAFADKLIANETEKAAEAVRTVRNALLEATDKEMLVDRADPQSERYAAMTAYRQALRDIPSQKGFPFDVEWPVKP